MSTKSENAEIAVLQTQMEDVKATIGSIDSKVDRLLDRFETTSTSFVTKIELRNLEVQLEKKIREARSVKLITHSLTAVLTATVTALTFWLVASLYN